jgi:hypothetical protein
VVWRVVALSTTVAAKLAIVRADRANHSCGGNPDEPDNLRCPAASHPGCDLRVIPDPDALATAQCRDMTSGRAWLAAAVLLAALPFGPATTDPHTTPAPAPRGEIVVGTVGQDGEPRIVPTHGRTTAPPPDLERGVVPDSPA